MVIGANWLTLCQECPRECFGSAVVHPVHRGAFIHSGKQALRLCWRLHVVAVMPSSGETVAVTGSLTDDLNRVSMWCAQSRIKLNESKTKSMIISMSRIIHPQSTPLTPDGTVLKESAGPVIYGMTFDAKMTFEKHLRSVSGAAALRVGIMRKSSQVFHDRSLILRSSWSFVLLV